MTEFGVRSIAPDLNGNGHHGRSRSRQAGLHVSRTSVAVLIVGVLMAVSGGVVAVLARRHTAPTSRPAAGITVPSLLPRRVTAGAPQTLPKAIDDLGQDLDAKSREYSAEMARSLWPAGSVGALYGHGKYLVLMAQTDATTSEQLYGQRQAVERVIGGDLGAPNSVEEGGVQLTYGLLSYEGSPLASLCYWASADGYDGVVEVDHDLNIRRTAALAAEVQASINRE